MRGCLENNHHSPWIVVFAVRRINHPLLVHHVEGEGASSIAVSICFLETTLADIRKPLNQK